MKKIIGATLFLSCAIAGRAQISPPTNGYLLVADPAAHAVHIYNTTTATYR